ncbi:MAG: FtsQ-type POTRA domain-containing protein [Bacillota bacterium]
MQERPLEPRSAEETQVVAALLGLLLVVGVYAFLQSPYFAVAEVDVQGTSAVAAEEIVALTGVHAGDNLLALDLDAIAAGVEGHPRIQRAEVRRALPGVLRVTVTEYEPLLLVVVNGEATALARDGTPIPVTPQEAERLPLVRGEADAAVLRLASLLPEDVHARVAEIVREGGSLTLRTRSGETILLGDGTQLERKLDIALDLLRQNRFAVIDVRFPSSPVVRVAP